MTNRSAIVDFKSPFTVAAMREMLPVPDKWYVARRYHRSVLAPAIEAGFIIEEPYPGCGRTARRYKLTVAGVKYLRSLGHG